MSMFDKFEKFNKLIDIEGLKQDMKELERKNSEFEEVPLGKYEVAIDRMELKETKNGDKVMLSIVFRIVEGNYKGRLIFYNQVIMNEIGRRIAIQMLMSLKSGLEMTVEDCVEFAELVSRIQDVVKDKYEYLLDYNENNKKFKTYSIVEVYED